MIQLQRWIYWSVLITLIALSAQNIYQGTVIADQKQTIEQYMGLQHGQHDGPAMPEPKGKPGLYLSPERTQNTI